MVTATDPANKHAVCSRPQRPTGRGARPGAKLGAALAGLLLQCDEDIDTESTGSLAVFVDLAGCGTAAGERPALKAGAMAW